MKIKDKDGLIIDIFSIYWFDDETYFYGLPNGYGGLIAYKANEISIIDSDINFNSVYFDNNAKSIHHWALIKEALLDDLIERDEVAYNRFLEIIKSEGLVNSDFF